MVGSAHSLSLSRSRVVGGALHWGCDARTSFTDSLTRPEAISSLAVAALPLLLLLRLGGKSTGRMLHTEGESGDGGGAKGETPDLSFLSCFFVLSTRHHDRLRAALLEIRTPTILLSQTRTRTHSL